MRSKYSDKAIVVSGVAVITSRAKNMEEFWKLITSNSLSTKPDDYSLNGFNALSHLPDRRMLKAVSHRDSYALAAIAELAKEGFCASDQQEYELGLFVGASPSSVFDNENYCDAIFNSTTTGGYSEREFGNHCMSARPTTLLLGLPNNALCYGAMILKAMGANNNFTSGETSAHIAMQAALRNIRTGKLQIAVSGGYGYHSDHFRYHQHLASGNHLAHSKSNYQIQIDPKKNHGTIAADAAAFIAIETAASCFKNNRRPIAELKGVATSCNALGLEAAQESTPESVVSCVNKAMFEAGIESDMVGLVLLTGSGANHVDASIEQGLRQVFCNDRHLPGIASATKISGNLMEASGIIECDLAARLYKEKQIPEALQIGCMEEFPIFLDIERPYSLILNAALDGNFSSLILHHQA